MNAIQYIEKAKNEDDAKEMLTGLMFLEGCIGGRTLPPSDVIDKNTWRVQAFFKDENIDTLPDGCRKVYISDSQKALLGIY